MKSADSIQPASISPPGTLGRDRRNELSRLDDLAHVLERASAAFRSDCPLTRESALAEGLSAVSALYSGGSSSNTSPHLDRVYDVCLRGLSDGYGGDLLALSAATTMARSMRAALGRVSVRPQGGRTSNRPSGGGRGGRRAA